LRDAIEAFQANVPVPKDWRQFRAEFLRATGFRSWRALEGKAKCCWISKESDVITFTPLRNGGAKGGQKGFQPFGAAPIHASFNTSAEELGAALLMALAECKSVDADSEQLVRP